MSARILDLRGLNCPEPVLKASRAMREMERGESLILECTDPLTTIDIPLYVSQSGHELQSQEKRHELLVFTIVKRR